jgi:hypothetical protein
MPDDKRTFESQTLNIKSVHPRGKVNKESGITKKKTNKLNDQRISFSKDIILRLIDWLEKE